MSALFVNLGCSQHPEYSDLEQFHVPIMWSDTSRYVEEISDVIQAYISEFEPTPITGKFDIPHIWFGPNEDVRVLVASNPDDFLPELRSRLEQFHASEFPYRPHVTTDLPMPLIPEPVFDMIYICQDKYQVLHAFPLLNHYPVKETIWGL
jgi:hypothetical protein